MRYLYEIHSDELAECEEYNNWLECRKMDTIENMELEIEDDPGLWHDFDFREDDDND